MAPSIRQRMIAWLCLGIVLLTGVAPAQGFVLCIEADGCIRVEVRTRGASCTDCESHEPNSTSEPSASSSSSREEDCACIDLSVPGSMLERRVPPKANVNAADLSKALTPTVLFQPFSWIVVQVYRLPHRVPRPPDSIHLIRSVVLLV